MNQPSMFTSLKYNDLDLNSFWFEYASPEAVYAWLEHSSQNPSSIYDRKNQWGDEFDKRLILRNEPLINFGLALYSIHTETAVHLYHNCNDRIKKAVLAGKGLQNYFAEDLLDEILSPLVRSGNHEYLSIYLANPEVQDSHLKALYRRDGLFSEIDEDLWCLLIHATCSNPRVAIPAEEKGFIDGGAEYDYNSVFHAGWNLLNTCPMDKRFAYVVAQLSETLVNESHEIKPLKVAKRWQSVDESNDSYFTIRTQLAGLIPYFEPKFESLKKSEDLALRSAYYRGFMPESDEDINSLFKKDGSHFKHAAVHNKKIVSNKLFRYTLDHLNTDEDELDWIWYNRVMEAHQQENPHWFEDDYDGTLPLEFIEDPEKRIQVQLEHLGGKIQKISKSLEADDDDFSNENLSSYIRQEFDHTKRKISDVQSVLKGVSIVIGVLLLAYTISK